MAPGDNFAEVHTTAAVSPPIVYDGVLYDPSPTGTLDAMAGAAE